MMIGSRLSAGSANVGTIGRVTGAVEATLAGTVVLAVIFD
jgi:hypothetical protein